MKIKVIETDDKGFTGLLGEQVTIFCLNYIYHGELIGVDEENLLLKNLKIVYETGKFSDKGFKDAQSLECDEFYIQKGVIESFGVLNLKND